MKRGLTISACAGLIAFSLVYLYYVSGGKTPPSPSDLSTIEVNAVNHSKVEVKEADASNARPTDNETQNLAGVQKKSVGAPSGKVHVEPNSIPNAAGNKKPLSSKEQARLNALQRALETGNGEINFAKKYTRLLRGLELGEEQTNQVRALLIQRELDLKKALAEGHRDGLSIKEIWQNRANDIVESYSTQMKSLLSGSQYEALATYESKMGANSLANKLGEWCEAQGCALTDDQMSKIATIVSSRQPAKTALGQSRLSLISDGAAALVSPGDVKKFSSILSSDQIAVIKEYQSAQRLANR
jgi:hypothetical protein